MVEWLEYDFVRNALMAMTLLALFYPLLGVFVVGQRLAYFGDAVAHSAFVGAGLAGLLGWQMGNTLLVTAPLFALVVAWFQQRTRLPADTLLVVSVTGISGLGIAMVNLLETPLSLSALLFGDVLGLEASDLWYLLGIDLLGIALLLVLAPSLIRIGFHRELAQAQGVPVRWVETLFLVGLSLAVAVGIRAVGILPISALLVLPASSARLLAHSFRGMMVWSAVLGLLSLVVGFLVALWQPIPPGASVAVVAMVLFLAIVLARPTQGAMVR
ncbi:MAG: metal ABC transporter permease [Fimbriimonadales bacterium]